MTMQSEDSFDHAAEDTFEQTEIELSSAVTDEDLESSAAHMAAMRTYHTGCNTNSSCRQGCPPTA